MACFEAQDRVCFVTRVAQHGCVAPASSAGSDLVPFPDPQLLKCHQYVQLAVKTYPELKPSFGCSAA